MINFDVIEWVKSLPYWQQEIAKSIIDNESPDDKFFDSVYVDFKKEVGLDSDKLVAGKIEFSEQNVEEKEKEITWLSVNNIKGVNRLKSDCALIVGSGLTLVYGENGSGKSGYTRLLNNAFISRGDKEILSDIYVEKPDQVHAEFKFKCDDQEIPLQFPRDKDNNIFRRVMAFDSKSALDDMLKESEISFIPSELQFFDTFLSACAMIQNKLDEECKKTTVENPITKYFNSGSIVENDINSLSMDTDIEGLKTKYLIKEEDNEEYEWVKTEKAALVALNIEEQVNKIKQVKKLMGELLEKANKYNNKINQQSIIEYKLMLEESLEGIELVDKYWEYLKSLAEQNYIMQIQKVTESIKSITDLNLVAVVEESIQEEWLNNNIQELFKKIKEQFSEAEKIKGKLCEVLTSEEFKEIPILEIDISIINLALAEIDEKEKKLNYDEIEKNIATLNEKESNYLDVKKLNELMPIIEQYVNDLKWLALASKKKFKQRVITNKQTELFDKYVTDDYLTTFANECKKLNAQFDAQIVQRGSKGTTLKKLSIKGLAPGKILSEGEQKAIAIANFLTEVEMDSKNIAIVLDDPVCSLDHKRRTAIAKRLLEESIRRQVVIFTHDITFFMEMKSIADKQEVQYEQETIRKVAGVPGNIAYAIPWQGMNVKDRIKKLNIELHDIETIETSGDTDAYFYKAKEWCELLRESWERAVEEILLNDAIQRYNPCVQTQRLKKAPFSIMLYTELEAGMSECSSWVHDRARALNEDIPSLEELKGYIQNYEKFTKENRVK
jgi:energy-coupling factor transporter ATP-binding protein EcfA2